MEHRATLVPGAMLRRMEEGGGASGQKERRRRGLPWTLQPSPQAGWTNWLGEGLDRGGRHTSQARRHRQPGQQGTSTRRTGAAVRSYCRSLRPGQRSSQARASPYLQWGRPGSAALLERIRPRSGCQVYLLWRVRQRLTVEEGVLDVHQPCHARAKPAHQPVERRATSRFTVAPCGARWPALGLSTFHL